jgi:hypothetical protein
MIAGLSCQVVSLFIFACACGEFALRCYKNPQSWSTTHAQLYNSKLWRAFLFGLALATLTIFVRSTYRVAELQAGFNGPLANDQPTFMVLEAAMVSIAALCITILHPGWCFKGTFHQANFQVRSKKGRGKNNSESLDSFSGDVENTQQHEMGRITK